MLVVSYYSDYAREYAEGLKHCDSFERLREFSLHWASLTIDAWEIVRRMDDQTWAEFQAGKKQENRGVFAGVTWHKKYGAVMMPELLISVAQLAGIYGVPWGTAFLQGERAGLIVRERDLYRFIRPTDRKEAQPNE